jgi:hypothetical protein
MTIPMIRWWFCFGCLRSRSSPRCCCGAAYTIGVTTTGPDSEAYYCDDCYVAEHSRDLCRATFSTDSR